MASTRLCAIIGLLAQVRASNKEEHRDLFDEVYTRHVRDATFSAHDAIRCIPRTLHGCSAEERAYIKEVKTLSLKELQNETAFLRSIEREAAQKGKPLKGAEDRRLMERKSILYHLIDDAKGKMAQHRQAANARWAKGHDEL